MSTPARSSDVGGHTSARSPAGFTLIELSVILLVLGIAVSFLIPRLRDAEHTRLTATAERLATTARYLYDETAFRQRPMRLNFDLDEHTYWISVFNEDPDDPAFVPDGSPLSRPAALPDAVRFTDVVLPGLGTVDEGIVFAQFLPAGVVDPVIVHLQSRQGDYATVALDPFSGRTRIGEGYHEIEVPPSALGERDEGRRRSGRRPRETDMSTRSRRSGGRVESAPR